MDSVQHSVGITVPDLSSEVMNWREECCALVVRYHRSVWSERECFTRTEMVARGGPRNGAKKNGVDWMAQKISPPPSYWCCSIH